jgi:serine protease AprX
MENHDRFGIRIINLSLGTPAFGKYADDRCAGRRARRRGGHRRGGVGWHHGKLPDGTPIVGGIVSPGYTPGALTVGALNTKDTINRGDDEVASYSSRGPVAIRRTTGN